ncbi:MAG TPA: hypothetical protein VL728_17830 [Cyclobacteriaceae bacterium]|nr:hypothetical protein [Cyclobacteriaceae bacterium]
MKIFGQLILLLATFSLSCAQDFEGKIVYKNDYKSNTASLTSEQLNTMMGTTLEYFIKGGNYKTSTNGTFLQWQLFINKDNKLYNKIAISLSLLWNDGAVNPDEVLSAQINKGVTDILGYKCDELILNCKSGVQKYYFSSQLRVDAKLFEQHKFGNWSEVLSRTNALPLKMIVSTPQFTVESIATQVVPMKLDDKMFELPPDSKTEKSPY